MSRRIVVIGGGPAAVGAAMGARQKNPAASVTLVMSEICEPYEKPPLSKGVLLGKAQPEDMPIAGPGGLASQGIDVRAGVTCTRIDPANKCVHTTAGTIAYDALVLATGAQVRELPLLPASMPRVHYLRTEADARALKADMESCRQMVIIGAGLIGLEVAASAAERGIAATVIEAAPRVMGRACDEETSAAVLAEHQHHGVEIMTGRQVVRATAQIDGDIALETDDGELYVAQCVVVGAGVRPDDALAAEAGLPTGDGIIVDEQCRTADPAIFAAGDVTRMPGPNRALVRLENWRHAQEQGLVAGRNAAGDVQVYRPVPSFWSEQYDLYIQGVGWPTPNPSDRVRRPLTGKASLMLEVHDGLVSHAVGVNAQRDMAAIRRLIERKVPVERAALEDPAQPFQAMLKAKV